MKNMMAYVKYHRMDFLLMGLWITAFLVVFSLSALPVEAVAYGFLLFLVLSMVLMILDFIKFVKRQKQLEEAREHIAITLEKLPAPENAAEERYQELLRAVFDYKRELESEYDNKYSEMLDYYTMWMHQIKTPIAAMHLLLQSEEAADREELSEQLFKIEEYVGMALSYIRVGNVGADLKIRQCSLDHILRQAVRKYAKSFIRKKIALDYQEIDCVVVTDEKWLLFVIEQILSNAIKYTKAGKISIYMDPNREKTLVIEDTGIGIAEEDLPRLFEKGFTGYNGRTHKKSTGIGLYLCKMIMKKLNHEIWLESAEGKGTRVRCGLQSATLEVD